MKKRKVFITLLLSIFGSYVSAQFNKQLTPLEQNAFLTQGDTSKVWEVKKQFFSHFAIHPSYVKEACSIIDYYETKKQLLETRNANKKFILEEINLLKEEYDKQICSILFLNGSYLSTPNYQLAFSLRNVLHLSESALRELAQKAIELKPDMEKDLDYWQVEFKELSTILTNKQMDYLLRKKNSQKSWQKVHKVWELYSKSKKHCTEKDSIAICTKLYSYYSKFAVADELYANDPKLKREAYIGIRRFAPSIVSSIEALQRKQKKQTVNKLSKQPEKKIVIKEQYLWAEHSNQAIEEDFKVKQAIMLALGAQGRIDRNTAFTNLFEYSHQGNATAMNAIGLMYLKGYGTKADTIMALDWWEKAGAQGCSDAYNNIGLFYKTEDNYLNLEKAYSYFTKAAEKGNIIGAYFAGYMLYKGLGCEQNYKKAVDFFKIGAQDSYAPSLYMLGLCYRNGYGIEQNEITGKLFLQQAASQSYKQALKELEQPMPENSRSICRTLGKKVNQSIVEYPQIKIPSSEIKQIENGEYTGSLITYDWSGKHIISEVPLKIVLSTHGNKFIGEWYEGEKESISITGELEGNKLIFGNKTRRINSRYKNMAQSYILQEAEIQVIELENETSILGTIQMYSVSTKEKERPMYLCVTKKEKKADDNIVIAYPNPFTQELNFLINMQSSDKVRLFIYSTNGEPVYQYDAGIISRGKQHLTIYPDLTKGTYIVKVFIGEKENQLTIISK